MDYKDDINQRKSNIKNFILLIAGIILLPLCLLMPFAVHSNNLYPVLGYSSIDGSRPDCIANGSLVAYNQCAVWNRPDTIWPLTVLLLLVILFIGFALNIYVTKLVHKNGKRFANLRLLFSLAISIISFMVFVIMRGASQNNVSHDYGFVSSHVAANGSLANMGPYVPDHTAVFGYGLTTQMALLLIIAFLLPVFISWQRFIFSRYHIEGQKKKDLFQ